MLEFGSHHLSAQTSFHGVPVFFGKKSLCSGLPRRIRNPILSVPEVGISGVPGLRFALEAPISRKQPGKATWNASNHLQIKAIKFKPNCFLNKLLSLCYIKKPDVPGPDEARL